MKRGTANGREFTQLRETEGADRMVECAGILVERAADEALQYFCMSMMGLRGTRILNRLECEGFGRAMRLDRSSVFWPTK